MSLNFAMFVLYQIMSSVRDKTLLDSIAVLILRPQIHSQLESMMKNPIPDPQGYFYEWSKKNKLQYEYKLIRYQ